MLLDSSSVELVVNMSDLILMPTWPLSTLVGCLRIGFFFFLWVVGLFTEFLISLLRKDFLVSFFIFIFPFLFLFFKNKNKNVRYIYYCYNFFKFLLPLSCEHMVGFDVIWFMASRVFVSFLSVFQNVTPLV